VPFRWLLPGSLAVFALLASGVTTAASPPRTPDALPAWSPDGSRLAFSRGNTTFIANADGTKLRAVGESAQPIWSRDGRQLLIAGLDAEIRLAGPDGSDARLIAQGDTPTWAPDGRSFAFGSGPSIVVADAAGQVQRTIAIRRDPQCPASSCGHAATDAAWSPTGDTIVFVYSTVQSGSRGVSQLYTVSADGSGLRALPTDFAVWNPVWSPDGKRIAFIQVDGFERERLHVIDLETGVNRVLTGSERFAWAPQADLIASVDSSTGDLFRADGRWHRHLPGVTGASWSPDGRRLVFARAGGIWISDRLGIHAGRVATGRSPAWSPRGGTIAFSASACGARQGIWLLQVSTGTARRVTRGCAP
jgi:Tol biopolymer transport system component